MTGAKAVMAGVDNESWLHAVWPASCAAGLKKWGGMRHTQTSLLTDRDYFGVTRRQRIEYQDPYISEFAHYFGKPELELTVDLIPGLLFQQKFGVMLYVDVRDMSRKD